MVMTPTNYATDLTEVERLLLAPLIPAAKPGGRPRDTDMFAVLNAIFYVVRSGTAWRLLPHDFLPWQTVYGYFATWQKNGVWQRMNDALREAVREQDEHEAQATAGSFDSQSIKSMNADANGRGFDGAKWIMGRKRFLLVDTFGWLLQVMVTSAKTTERHGAELLFDQTSDEILAHLQLVWADGGFAGVAFATWLYEHFDCLVEIVKRPRTATGLVIQPRRWVVERTFGWLSYFRRLSKDYERKATSSVAFIYTAMIRLMLQRLAQNPLLYA
jgi:putative transposase